MTLYQTNTSDVLYTEFQCPRIDGHTSDLPVFSFPVNLKPEKSYHVVASFNHHKFKNIKLSVYHNIPDFHFIYPSGNHLSLFTNLGNWRKRHTGHWGKTTFLENPQYDLILPEPTNVTIVLKASRHYDVRSRSPNKDVFTNVHVVPIGEDQVGKHFRWYNPEEAMFEMMYSRFAFYKEVKNMPAGKYRVIASSYETHVEASFDIKIVLPDAGKDFPTDKVEFNEVGKEFTCVARYYQKMHGFRQVFWVHSYKDDNRVLCYFFRIRDLTYRACNCRYSGSNQYESEEEADFRSVNIKNDSKNSMMLRACVYDEDDNVVWETDWTLCVYALFVEFTVPYSSQDYRVLVEQHNLPPQTLHAYAIATKEFDISSYSGDSF